MKRVIYMALTLASAALSLGGCSSAITTKDLTIIEEAEKQTSKNTTTSNSNDKAVPTDSPVLREDGASAIMKANDLSDLSFEIEGSMEVVSVREYISSLGYQIKMDEERFNLETIGEADLYTASNPNTSVYPDTYIKITKTDKSDHSNYIDEIKQQLLLENPRLEEILDTKISTYDPIVFKSIFGGDYNSAIKMISIIETVKAYYTIETQYFIEAAEGYGARMKALLDTLIINE